MSSRPADKTPTVPHAPETGRGPLRILFWGTYDLGKPRNRLLRQGLREAGATLFECHASVWEGVEDKSQVGRADARLRLLWRWLIAYPALVVRYIAAPRHDAVLVGYMGPLDVLVLWPLAKLRGAPIVFDVLMSLYNATVEDRALVGPRHPVAWLLYALEWLAVRAADAVVVNTAQAADYWVERFGARPDKLHAILTGAETDAFPRRPAASAPPAADTPVRILFYGTFIPLHGVETIVRAARLCRDEPVDWLLVGQGQDAGKVRAMLLAQPLPRLTWLPWVDYAELAGQIHAADLCLGIFGATRRAGWSIPNKLFQILATGTPVITRDSPGIRTLLAPDAPGVYLVPPDDPQAIADAVRQFRHERAGLAGQPLHVEAVQAFAPATVGAQVLDLARRLTARRSRA